MDRYSQSPLPLYGNSAQKAGPRPPNMGLPSQFQISGYQVLASVIFWICMMYLGFKGFQYGVMYMGLDDGNMEALGCCKNAGGSIEDNANVVDGYNKGDAGPYLMRLGPESYTTKFKGTQSPKELEYIPTIVTAVQSSDFYDVQGLIKQINEEIRPAFNYVKFIIYDIGLWSKELELVSIDVLTSTYNFANSLDPDQDRQNVGPDLAPNRLTLLKYS